MIRRASILFAVVALTHGAMAVSINPSFPAELLVEQGITLERKGTSQLTVGFVFKVYDAALYLPPGAGPENALDDAPRHLEISYLRSISRDDFIGAANDMLAAQHDPRVIDSIKEGIDRINALYQDVRKGDRYSLTYLPGSGTYLKFNGETKGIIEGSDFARIYFSIWLGENNPYKQFRDRLVGLK